VTLLSPCLTPILVSGVGCAATEEIGLRPLRQGDLSDRERMEWRFDELKRKLEALTGAQEP
jgi:hypothetical protein